jgi:hypothetical protein
MMKLMSSKARMVGSLWLIQAKKDGWNKDQIINNLKAIILLGYSINQHFSNSFHATTKQDKVGLVAKKGQCYFHFFFYY